MQLSSSGPGITEAQPDAAPARTAGNSTPFRLSAFAPLGQEAAAAAPQQPIMPQAVLVGNMQSIETAIALKAMQRIAALFQQSQAPADGGAASQPSDAVAVPASAFAALPRGGSSAFVPLPPTSPQAPAGATQSEPSGQHPKPCPVVVNVPSDGAFCGDSDVVGDIKVCGAPQECKFTYIWAFLWMGRAGCTQEDMVSPKLARDFTHAKFLYQ